MKKNIRLALLAVGFVFGIAEASHFGNPVKPTRGGTGSATQTPSRALETDSSGNVISSTVTATELGRLSGVSAAVQTQINGVSAQVAGNSAAIQGITGNFVHKTGDTLSGTIAISKASSSDQIKLTRTGSSPGTSFIGAADDSILFLDSASQPQMSFLMGVTPTVSFGNDSTVQLIRTGTNSLRVHAYTTFNNPITYDQAFNLSGVSTVALANDNEFYGLTGTTASIINGIVASPRGTEMMIYSDSSPLTLGNESSAASATNRISSLSGADIVCSTPPCWARLMYDGTTSRWLVTGFSNQDAIKTRITGSRAVVTDASSNLTNSAVTSTELGYVSGVTAAVQTQINAVSAQVAGSASEIQGITNNVAALQSVTGNFLRKAGDTQTGKLAVINNLNGGLEISTPSGSAGFLISRTGSSAGSFYLGTAGDRDGSSTYDELQFRKGSGTSTAFLMRGTDAGVQTLFWGSGSDASIARTSSGVLTTTGQLVTNGLAVAAGFDDAAAEFVAPSSAFDNTIANSTMNYVLAPSTTIASSTIRMPASPRDGQMVELSCNSNPLTLVTHLPNTSQTLLHGITTCTPPASAGYIYRSSNSTWYRRH